MRALSAMVLGFALMVVASTGQAAEKIKMATIAAKTGDAAATNLVLFEAARYAVDQINQQGGLLGKQIELIEYDNMSTALGSKSAAQKTVEQDVLAVIGASWSAHSIAAGTVLQAAKIPMISPISTNPEVTRIGDYIFRVCYIDPFQGNVMAKFAVTDLQAKSCVALVNADRKYSTDLADFFARSFEEKGGKVLWKGEFLIDVSNYDTLLEKVKPFQPDVIYLPSDYRDSSHIIGQARKMGLKAVFLGGDAYGVRMYEYIGDLLDGNYYTTHWHRDDPSPVSRDFVRSYEAKHGEIKQTTIPLTYDAVMILVDAVRRAQTLDRSVIRDTLAKTRDFQGITGTISFDEDRNPIKPAVILKFEQGNVVYVKTVAP